MTQSMILKTAQVGPWGMNSYALICPETQASVLFDPGGDPEKLMEMLGDSRPVAILLTHSHIDHVMVLDEMREQLQVPLMLHPGEHADDFEIDEPPARWLETGDTVSVGQHTLRVENTPGHIGDQICFHIEGDHRIIVGDTIFDGGPGRTWSHTGFLETLETLKNVVLLWPDESLCYPGHGPSFKLGDIRSQVEAFVAKDHGRFYGDAEWGM